MIDVLAEISAATRIDTPAEIHRNIGVVGAGAIMDVAHLPAYASGRLPVLGVFDVNVDRARAVAARHGIAQVYSQLDDLLGDDRIEVVDVAVPAAVQPDVTHRAISAGKHVLSQKPFAPDPQTGSHLVEAAASKGTALAVNQQLRFDEGISAAHAMVERGWIGKVTAMTITVDIWTEWSDWPWLLTTDRLEISNHSIHYHDAIRWFLGEPDTVFCADGRRPGQQAAGETRTISTYIYADGRRALVHANHMNDHGDARAEFRIDGSRGAIRGTLGLLYDYPRGRPDTLEVNSREINTDGWLPYPVTTRWIPDAFLGPMSSLLWHLATGRPLRSSGADNLGTLRLVQALYQSMSTRAAVALPVAQHAGTTDR